MSGPSMRNPVGGVYLGDVFMRHPLTTQNQEELDIAGKADSILNRPQQLAALMRVPEGGGEPIAPIGFSLNDVRYLGYPQDQATASELGLRAYWNMGVPVVDEVSRVEQPPPDMVSRQTYINGTDPVEMTATDTVEFSISNTLSWSLQGDVQLTFGATASAQVEAQLEKSVQAGQSQTTTLLNSKDDVGVNAEFATEGTSAVMATGTATGTGEVSAQLLMGLSASVGGELTTSWTHTSEISLTVSSRVDVMATTYREIRQFLYSYGVTYGGWVALWYPKPVPVAFTPPQPAEPRYSQVIAWPLGEIADRSNNFDLADEGKRFMQKGRAEIVAVRAGEHRVFQPETIDFASQKQPL